jgi:hypothetical protein
MVSAQKVIFFENITYCINDVNLKNINHAVIWNDDVRKYFHRAVKQPKNINGM